MKATVLALAKVILGVGAGTVAFGMIGSYARVDGLLDCYLIMMFLLLYPAMSLTLRRPAAVRVRRQALHLRIAQLAPSHSQRRRDGRRQLDLATMHRPLVAGLHGRLDHQAAPVGK